MLNFSLRPFTSDSLTDGIRLVGRAARCADALLITYDLRGRLEELLLPEQTAAPARRDWLWQQSCFELFAAPAGSPRYWEVNLSPSGDWNVYAFDGYRTGMREEPALAALPFHIRRQAGLFRLELAFPLDALVLQTEPVELGISAVLQNRSGQISCWALAHCGPRPDFHLRESLILPMPAFCRSSFKAT